MHFGTSARVVRLSHASLVVSTAKAAVLALDARPESRIVVVGHSAFFRALLLPEPVRFTNCAVWRATLTATGEPAWRGAVELFPGWESFSEEDAAESTARETAAQSAPP